MQCMSCQLGSYVMHTSCHPFSVQSDTGSHQLPLDSPWSKGMVLP